jgi:hypothetical protein
MKLVKALEGFHALHESLGIIETIDADHQRSTVEAGDDVADKRGLHRSPRLALERVGIKADGKAADAGLPGPTTEHELIVGRFESLARSTMLGNEIADEIADVGFGLESDKVVLEEQGKQPFMVGQHGHDFRRRERDVQEEADAVGVTALAELLGDRDQVIVVNPDDVVRLEDLRKLAGEVAVHSEIAGEVAAGELGQIDAIMQDRPQHPVGEAVVVFLIVLLGQSVTT